MYFYLNTEVFTDPKDNIVADDIIITFKNIIELIKKLADYDSDLIFNKDFLHFEIDGENIYAFLERNFDEDEVRIITRRLEIQCSNSQCSDVLEDYLHEDMEIDYLSSKDNISKEDILGTAIACSLYNEVPMITPDKLCKDNHHYLNEEIEIEEEIEDSDNKIHKIKNILLSNYTQIIEMFDSGYIEEPPSWEDYIKWSEENLDHTNFTKNCKKDFRKNSNLSPKYTRLIRDQIEKLDALVETNGGDPKRCSNIRESGVKAREESGSRLNNLEDKLKKKNCCNNKMVMSWHTRVDYYRLYFTCNHNNKICFTFFTEKIPNR